MEKLKKFWPYLFLAIFAVPAVWNLFKPGYFDMHDDLQVMRLFEINKCFNDGQLPCRWAPDMAYGYGQPMFNFYSAFPYYLGQFIRMLAPISMIWTVKLLFVISLVAALAGMYFLAREFWGNLGGILAGVLYIYAPYHSLDVYVRGALAESFALMLLPFLWLAIYKLIQKGGFTKVLITCLVLGLFLTTHNVSALIIAPFTLLWAVFWIVKFKRYQSIKDVILSGLLGVGIAAFFLVPVAFETGLIQSNFLTMDYLDYRGHFVTLYQLFISRIWGYGPSIFGPNDNLSFDIGWPNWWLIIPLVGMGAVWLKSKAKRKYALLILTLLAFAGISIFLTHERSTPIWLNFSFLSIIQFPWRFLGPSVFFLSLASGALLAPEYKYRNFMFIFLVALSIGLNFFFFRPQNYFYNESDASKLEGESFVIQEKSAILDYLPKTAESAPKEEAPGKPVILSGEGEVLNYSKRSNSFFFDANIYNSAEIQVPVMYFPGWKVISENEVLQIYPSGNYGVITFKLPDGKYIVQGRLTNTLPRVFGNAISLISLMSLLIGFVLTVNDRKFLWLRK